MRRLVIGLWSAPLVALAVTGAVAAASGPQTARVTVSPRAGTASTRFEVRFTSPERTGTFPGSRSWETAAATGPKRTDACSGTVRRRVRPVAAHARVGVRLAPSGQPWCVGAYVGTITLHRAVRCRPGPVAQGHVCPLIEFAPQRIGRFRFTVRSARPH